MRTTSLMRTAAPLALVVLLAACQKDDTCSTSGAGASSPLEVSTGPCPPPPPPPPPLPPPLPAAGWTVSGKVVKDVAGAKVPVAGIQLELKKAELPFPQQISLFATTDASGSYTFAVASVEEAVGKWTLKPTNLRDTYAPASVEVTLLRDGNVGIFPFTLDFTAQAKSFSVDLTDLPATDIPNLSPAIPAGTYNVDLLDGANGVGTVPVEVTGAVWHAHLSNGEDFYQVGTSWEPPQPIASGTLRIKLDQATGTPAGVLWAMARWEITIGVGSTPGFLRLRALDAGGALVAERLVSAPQGPFTMTLGPFAVPLPRVSEIEISGIGVRTEDHHPVVVDP